MKIPTLLSSYHAGNGRESMDAQSGVYCCSVNGKREQQRIATKTVAWKKCILVILLEATVNETKTSLERLYKGVLVV